MGWEPVRYRPVNAARDAAEGALPAGSGGCEGHSAGNSPVPLPSQSRLKITAKVKVLKPSGVVSFLLWLSPFLPRGLMKSCNVSGSSLSTERIKRRSNIRIPLLPLRFILSETRCDYGSLMKPSTRHRKGTETGARKQPRVLPSRLTKSLPIHTGPPGMPVLE